jgi:hypothetical protein
MLDTVGIKHYFRYLPKEFIWNNWQKKYEANNPTWILNEKSEVTLPNLTLVKTPNNFWHLSAQVSLPKFIFGHNAKLPTQNEVNQGLERLGEYVEKKSGLNFNVETATVYLIHFTYDIHLTDPIVWKMIGKLSKRNLKSFRNMFIEGETVYFRTNSKKKHIQIYSKLKETLDSKCFLPEAVEYAKGNLRFECAFLNKKEVKALSKNLGLTDCFVQTVLNENVSIQVISKVLDDLNFFDLLNFDKSTFQILSETFPTKKAMDLSGFLEAINNLGKDFYKNEVHSISKSTYDRKVRDCIKAKVW